MIRHGDVAVVPGLALVQLVAWWCVLCQCHHRGDCTHPLG